MSKDKILYFIMGSAAIMFAAADVIAEFDEDPDTHTATHYVKRGIKHPVGAVATAIFCIWLPLHFFTDLPI